MLRGRPLAQMQLRGDGLDAAGAALPYAEFTLRSNALVDPPQTARGAAMNHFAALTDRWIASRWAARLSQAAAPVRQRLETVRDRLAAAQPPAALAPWVARAAALQQQFDQRAPRERILIMAATIAAAAVLVDALWLTPAWKDWSRARQERQQAQQALVSLQDSIANLRIRGAQERQQLEAELRQLRESHGASAAAAVPPKLAKPDTRRRAAAPDAGRSAGGLVAANEMLPLLGKLMRSHPGLKVRGLSSLGHSPLGATAALPATPVVARASAANPIGRLESRSGFGTRGQHQRPGTGHLPPWRRAHAGGQLRRSGGLPAGCRGPASAPASWGQLQLRVDEYPRVQMTVRLYTP